MVNDKYLKEWQKDVIERKEKYVVCNWSRGLSKSYTMAQLIKNKQPKNVLYLSYGRLKNLESKIRELQIFYPEWNNTIDRLNIMRDSIDIIYNNGLSTNIESNLKYGKEYDYIIIDEIFNIGFGKLFGLLGSLKFDKCIMTCSINNANKWLQKVLVFNDGNIYFDEKDCMFGTENMYDKRMDLLMEDYKRINIETYYNEFNIKYYNNEYEVKDDNEEQSFNDKMVDKLKQNAESLCKSMDKAIQQGEWTTYKNLAQSLEKVMFLINEYDDNKSKVINCNDIIVNGDLDWNKAELKKLGIDIEGKSLKDVMGELSEQWNKAKANNIGEELKNIIARYGRNSEVIQNTLKEYNINIEKERYGILPFSDFILELKEVWKDISIEDKNNLIEFMAGERYQNVFRNLVEN